MIHAAPSGVLLDLRVQPGAVRGGIVGTYGDALKVKVSAPASDGRANDAVLALLAAALRLRPGQVTLVSGASSRTKRVLLTGVTVDEVGARLGPWVRHRSESG